MCAVPNMAVFCSSLTLCFPGMLLTYYLNDFEIVPIAPIITGITFVVVVVVIVVVVDDDDDDDDVYRWETCQL